MVFILLRPRDSSPRKSHLTNTSKKIPTEIIETIQNDRVLTDENNSMENTDLYEIYEEQILYNNAQIKDSYFIAGFESPKNYLGGVFLFLDTETKNVIDTPSPGFQAIAKLLYSLNVNIKLNSLVIQAMISFLKEKGYNTVYVNPLPNHRKILLKHCGFLKVEDEPTLVLEFS
jgi:hypothetical protein